MSYFMKPRLKQNSHIRDLSEINHNAIRNRYGSVFLRIKNSGVLSYNYP